MAKEMNAMGRKLAARNKKLKRCRCQNVHQQRRYLGVNLSLSLDSNPFYAIYISCPCRLSGQVLDQLWSIGTKFGLISCHCVSAGSTINCYTRVLSHRTVLKSSGHHAIVSQEVLWVLAILIKDIKHNYHHGKDDGDQADIDGECVLAWAICEWQVASG